MSQPSPNVARQRYEQALVRYEQALATWKRQRNAGTGAMLEAARQTLIEDSQAYQGLLELTLSATQAHVRDALDRYSTEQASYPEYLNR